MTTNSIAVPQATAPQHTPIASSDRQAARPTMPHDSQAAMAHSAADPNTPWRMPTQTELRETLRQVQLRADDITDDFWKNSYLTRNPYVVRAQALAQQWGLGVVVS